MKITEQTMATAQAAYDHIISNPEQHCQDTWVQLPGGEHRVTEQNFCGTTMCVAGTAVFVTDGIEGLNRAFGGWSRYAGPLLGFETEWESDHLFYCMSEEKALNLLNALAQGDEAKFNAIADITYDDE